MDIKIVFDETGAGDAHIVGGVPEIDDGLWTSVYISLFTDSGSRSWWGDPSLGSELWTLAREKFTDDNMKKAKEMISTALGWMIDEGVATSISVDATRLTVSVLAISVEIQRPNAEQPNRYNFNWEAMAA